MCIRDRRYTGQAFFSLAKRVETEDGQIITPPEGTEYHCMDIGLKMNSDGAFLIMEGADRVKVEAFPIGDEVYEFVSAKRISLLKEQYGCLLYTSRIYQLSRKRG